MSVQEFCVAYNAEDFDKTVAFYTDVLEFSPGVSWDRSDGRGVFLSCADRGAVEIFGAARGKPALAAPPRGSFMVVILVEDADAWQRKLLRNGAGIRWKMATYEWGKYFGVVDPNEVGIYFMQRLGEDAEVANAAFRADLTKNGKTT